MTAFDYAILLIVGFSVLLSLIRGLVREVLALASWIAAFWVAMNYATRLAPLLPNAMPGDSLRLLVAFLILFVATLLVMSLAAMALSGLAKTAGLGVVDRALGALFGLVRGVLIVLVLVLLAGLTALPHQQVWQGAMLSAPLEALAISVKPWLPGDLARRINY